MTYERDEDEECVACSLSYLIITSTDRLSVLSYRNLLTADIPTHIWCTRSSCAVLRKNNQDTILDCLTQAKKPFFRFYQIHEFLCRIGPQRVEQCQFSLKSLY